MARDHVFPRLFAIVHPRWETPWVGSLIIAGIAALGLLLTTASTSLNDTFGDALANIGVLVALYYGLSGLACAWAFRRILGRSLSTLLLAGVLPALSGLFLLWIAYQVVAQSGLQSSIPVLVTLGFGIPLLVLAVVLNRTGFFRRPTVTYGAEPAGAESPQPAVGE
jgi:amino acid transporter